MNISNLAMRLEEFEATENESRMGLRPPPRMSVLARPQAAPRSPRRLTLTTRRMQNREPCLRQFRVF